MKGYPCIHQKSSNYVVWAFFVLANAQLIWNCHNDSAQWLLGLYGIFELGWEFLMVLPYWARRKVIFLESLINRYYGSSASLAASCTGESVSLKNPGDI